MLRTLAVAVALQCSLALAAEPGTPPPNQSSPPTSPPPPRPGQPGMMPGMMPPPKAAPLTPDELNKALYALGLSLGRNVAPFMLTKQELAEVTKGFNDEVNDAPRKVKFEEMMPKVQQLFQERRSKYQEIEQKKNAEKSQGEIKKGEEFQAKAAKEPGAEKTASGLIYKVVTPGTGASPAATDTVS